MSFFTSEWLLPQKEHIVRLDARAIASWGGVKSPLMKGTFHDYPSRNEVIPPPFLSGIQHRSGIGVVSKFLAVFEDAIDKSVICSLLG